MTYSTPDTQEPAGYDEYLALLINSARDSFLNKDKHHTYINRFEGFIDFFFPRQDDWGKCISFFRISNQEKDATTELPLIQLEPTSEGESLLPVFPALPTKFDETTISSSIIQGDIKFYPQKTIISARFITEELLGHKDFRISFNHSPRNHGSVEFQRFTDNINPDDILYFYDYIKQIFGSLSLAQEQNLTRNPSDFSTN